MGKSPYINLEYQNLKFVKNNPTKINLGSMLSCNEVLPFIVYMYIF